VEELRVGTPERATLSSRALPAITVAPGTIYGYDVSFSDGCVRADEQLDEAARADCATAATIEGAVVVFAGGQRRDLQ
jgi:hypothetical protein